MWGRVVVQLWMRADDHVAGGWRGAVECSYGGEGGGFVCEVAGFYAEGCEVCDCWLLGGVCGFGFEGAVVDERRGWLVHRGLCTIG